MRCDCGPPAAKLLARILRLSDMAPCDGCAVCRNGPIWSAPVAKMHRSETAHEMVLRQAAVIQGLMSDLERTVQILNVDICTEEERVGVFDRSDPTYSIGARILTARRNNLNVTIAFLAQRLRVITEAIPIADATAA